MFDWGFSTFEYLPVRQTKASPRGLPDSNTGRHLVLPSLHRGLAPASVVRAKLLANPEVKRKKGSDKEEHWISGTSVLGRPRVTCWTDSLH